MKQKLFTAIAILACLYITAYGGVESAQAEIDRLRVEQAQAHETAEAARSTITDAQATWAVAQADIDALQAYIDMTTLPIPTRTVAYSDTYLASFAVKQYGSHKGNYKLSFYCPCVTCNGRIDALTASGTTIAEGHTIAVDSRYIPLGSRVYIDGYGVFIAEDTGGAIKGNRIDVAVSSHTRAYEIGVQYADVWVLS